MTLLFRLLFGFVEFRFFGGFCDEFINECFSKELNITDITALEDGFTASCGIKTYRNLHRLALRHGGKVRIIRKRGLPFILRPLKNRTGFFIGAVLFIFILCFLGGFVWEVELKGCSSASKAALSAFAENNGLKTGAMWSSIDRSGLAWEIMGEFDGVARAHINRFGTTAVLEIDEATPKPDKANQDELEGKKVFRRELTASVNRRQSKITIKKLRRYRTLIFFNLRIPLYFNIKECDTQELSKNMLKIKDTALPIGIETNECKTLNSQHYELTDDELLKLTKEKLAHTLAKELDGYTVINSSLDIDMSEDKCVIVGAYVVRKNH